MSLRDISFWVRSAKTDAAFEKLRATHGAEKAFNLLYTEKRDLFGSTRRGWRYQNLKYERVLSFLPRQSYRTVLDVGCGLGPFTRQLSPYADDILGVDFSSAAVEQARKLSISQPNVRFEQQDIHNIGQIGRRFDLITVLDVLYYLSPLSDEVLESVARQLEGLLEPGGVILLVNHYFFGIDPQSRQTRRIHDRFQHATSMRVLTEHRRSFFLTTVFTNVRPVATFQPAYLLIGGLLNEACSWAGAVC